MGNSPIQKNSLGVGPGGWSGLELTDALRLQKFKKLAVLFLEIRRHKVPLFTQKQLMASQYLPPELGFNDVKITFHDQKKWLSWPKIILP